MRRFPFQLGGHPELRVIASPGYIEHRVENWYTSRDGKERKIVHNTWNWSDAFMVAALAVLWLKFQQNLFFLIVIASISLFFIYWKCTTVLWQSIIAIPPHGVQLETHKGLPSLPLFVSRRFIPTIAIRDIVINEAFRRWDVRYYLALIVRTSNGETSLVVAFEHILPHFPVLLEVYDSLNEALYLDLHRNKNST